MQEAFEISKTEEGQTLLARYEGEDAFLVEKMLARIEAKEANPEKRLMQERRLLTQLAAECNGLPLKEIVADYEAYTDAVLQNSTVVARETRHIGVQTMGLALCALVLLARSGMDLVGGLRAGKGWLECMTTLDLGHLIACIAILVSVRMLVAGDRKADFVHADKVRKRTVFAVIGALLAGVALFVPAFGRVAILHFSSVAILGFAVLLLLVWGLSRYV